MNSLFYLVHINYLIHLVILIIDQAILIHLFDLNFKFKYWNLNHQINL